MYYTAKTLALDVVSIWRIFSNLSKQKLKKPSYQVCNLYKNLLANFYALQLFPKILFNFIINKCFCFYVYVLCRVISENKRLGRCIGQMLSICIGLEKR